MADIPQDSADGSRWMTYSELGQARGISRSSAERLARRLKWPRQMDNEARARVLVPPQWTSLADDSPDITGRRMDALATLRVSVETARQQAELLREQLAREVNRGDKAEARIQELTAALERATGDIRAAQAAAEQARAQADRLARQVNATAEVEAARRAMGRWARLRAAGRGG